jgi:hypothetical protein
MPNGGTLKKKTVLDLVAYDSEMGVENAIVLIPIAYALEWRRYDDAIDYHEEVGNALIDSEHSTTRLVDLKCYLYPFLKGKPPADVYGLLLWLRQEKLAPSLTEMLYVWWS